jgi:hypothetical protein
MLHGKFIFLFLILFACSFSVYGQGHWSVNSSLQYASGNYLSTQRLNSFYLYGGVRYQTNDYSVALSIPFIASNGQNVSQFGNIYMPNHMGSGTSGMSGNGGRRGGGMMGNGSLVTSSSPENYGIGDLYLYGNYNLLNQFTSPLGFSGFIKFPTASTDNGFGTGKFDFSLSATLRKNVGTVLVYASGGYIFLGKPESIDYKDPATFNFGIGKSFGNGDFSALLSYSLYSKILDIYELPQQLSLGVNIISNPKITYTLIGSAGLSNSTPDYAFSVGLKYNITN